MYNMERWVRARGKSSDNDWNTTPYIWDKLMPHIPKDRDIWCPFYNDGTSGEYLAKQNLNVIHQPEDFWETMYDDVVVVDNPPYRIPSIVKLKYKIMLRLCEAKIPFMLLFPSTTIQTHYFKKLEETYGKFQVIMPCEKYDFIKSDGSGGKCLFYTLWICWNMDLPKDLISL